MKVYNVMTLGISNVGGGSRIFPGFLVVPNVVFLSTRSQKADWVIKLPPKIPQSLSLILLDMRPKRKWFHPLPLWHNTHIYIIYTFYFLPPVTKINKKK
jgi:hypothetical protein